jgi:hypothetical protein
VFLLFESAFTFEEIAVEGSEFLFALLVYFLGVCLVSLETFGVASGGIKFVAMGIDCFVVLE